MRNGIRSSKLTLVNTAGRTTTDDGDDTPPAQDYPTAAFDSHGDISQETNPGGVSPILVLFTVSLACATAAIAAGSYALWLSRQKAARQTLTDVQDILKRCQDRMHQMEDDLNHLPNALTSTLG